MVLLARSWMSDSELLTDLRRPCTPSRGPASAVLAHPSTDGIAPVLGAGPRSGAPGRRISRHQSEALIEAPAARRGRQSGAMRLLMFDAGAGRRLCVLRGNEVVDLTAAAAAAGAAPPPADLLALV